MFSILSIVLPIFALVFTGWLARRTGVLGPSAAGELNKFVVYLALPALLLDVVARARPAEIWQPGFIASFGLSCALAFGLVLAIRWRSERHLADAAIDALAASYANTGYMGFPLALAVFGREALPPCLIATILTVCVIFAVAIVLIEISLQGGQGALRVMGKVGGSLIKNPLLIAPLIGAFFPLTGAHMPDSADRYLQLLGGAASPCALVSLGLFLAEKRKAIAHDAGGVALLIMVKLILQPLAAWILATQVFRLPHLLAQSAVLLAALPTGTGPFMLAEFYSREAATTSKAIIGSTILSIFTVTAYLIFMRR